jgi:hypothetical protein
LHTDFPSSGQTGQFALQFLAGDFRADPAVNLADAGVAVPAKIAQY